MYKRVIFGDVANDNVAALTRPELRASSGCWRRVAAAVLLMGIWPKPFIDVMNQSVIDLLAHVAKTKL